MRWQTYAALITGCLLLSGTQSVIQAAYGCQHRPHGSLLKEGPTVGRFQRDLAVVEEQHRGRTPSECGRGCCTLLLCWRDLRRPVDPCCAVSC